MPDARLLLAGLIAAVLGGVVRNLFDSDLYVPANAFTMATLCGLTAGMGTTGSAREGTAGRALPRGVAQGVAAIFGLALLVHAGSALSARMAALNAETELRKGASQESLADYESAARADPLDPEYRLQSALLYAATGQQDRAREAYEQAVHLAPIGRCFYRYGRFLEKQGQLQEAIRQFEAARRVEPRNLQNLLALAEAYTAAHRWSEAVEIYRQMVALYHSPYGQVRALPELITWEFATAYVALADDAREQRDNAAAEANLRAAVEIYRQFWAARTLQIARIQIRPEVMSTVTEQYLRALQEWSGALRALGRTGEAAAADEERARVQRERDEDARSLQPLQLAP